MTRIGPVSTGLPNGSARGATGKFGVACRAGFTSNCASRQSEDRTGALARQPGLKFLPDNGEEPAEQWNNQAVLCERHTAGGCGNDAFLVTQKQHRPPEGGLSVFHMGYVNQLERARRFERPTLTLARLCSTPELRPRSVAWSGLLWIRIPDARAFFQRAAPGKGRAFR